MQEALLEDHERPFEAFRSARSEAAKAIVRDVANHVLNYEKLRRPRKRERRSADQVILEQTLEAVVCDLIHRYLERPEGAVYVSLSKRHLGKRSRYRSPALGNTLPSLLEVLAAPEMAFVETSKGGYEVIWPDGDDDITYRRGVATTMWAGPRLISRLAHHELTFHDLSRSQQEIIVLRNAKVRGQTGELVEYEDSAETRRYRADLQRINAWLQEADLVLALDESEPDVDLHERRLRRVFNDGSFRRGGRLFGGFWQYLSREKRRMDLSINGEPVAELDYGQMALRLLYGRAGVMPPEGDLYAVSGLESYREGVKTILTSALFSTETQTRMPKGARRWFPLGLSYGRVLDAIRAYHDPVADHFFSDMGMELMFEESEIMVALLLRLADKDVHALPLHDGVMVASSSASSVRKAMEEVFEEKTGVPPSVRLEQLPMNPLLIEVFRRKVEEESYARPHP